MTKGRKVHPSHLWVSSSLSNWTQVETQINSTATQGSRPFFCKLHKKGMEQMSNSAPRQRKLFLIVDYELYFLVQSPVSLWAKNTYIHLFSRAWQYIKNYVWYWIFFLKYIRVINNTEIRKNVIVKYIVVLLPVQNDLPDFLSLHRLKSLIKKEYSYQTTCRKLILAWISRWNLALLRQW